SGEDFWSEMREGASESDSVSLMIGSLLGKPSLFGSSLSFGAASAGAGFVPLTSCLKVSRKLSDFLGLGADVAGCLLSLEVGWVFAESVTVARVTLGLRRSSSLALLTVSFFSSRTSVSSGAVAFFATGRSVSGKIAC